jgi:hypothetical protein
MQVLVSVNTFDFLPPFDEEMICKLKYGRDSNQDSTESTPRAGNRILMGVSAAFHLRLPLAVSDRSFILTFKICNFVIDLRELLTL